jgi:hypothetical protein
MSFSDTLADAILSMNSDAIIAANKEGIIRFWNPGAERIFGYASGAAIGQSLSSRITTSLLSSRAAIMRSPRVGESTFGPVTTLTALSRGIISFAASAALGSPSRAGNGPTSVNETPGRAVAIGVLAKPTA